MCVVLCLCVVCFVLLCSANLMIVCACVYRCACLVVVVFVCVFSLVLLCFCCCG